MIKNILSPFLIILSLLGIYYGAILPFKKSQLFIDAYQSFNSQPTVKSLEDSFTKALSFYSPIGQEEERRYLGGRLLSLFVKEMPKQVGEELIRYYESWFDFEREKGNGLNWTQNLLILGNLRQRAWELFKDEKDYAAAERFYVEGLKLSPTRPQFLYGLRELYKSKGEGEKEQMINNTIDSYWLNR